MIASSLLLGVAGLAASFGPADLLAALNAPTVEPLPVLIQLLGALYLGSAFTNWIAKDNIIGGIYSRPIALGNNIHFVVGALALLKYGFAQGFGAPVVVALMVYTIFAVCFMYLVFGLGAACKVASRES